MRREERQEREGRKRSRGRKSLAHKSRAVSTERTLGFSAHRSSRMAAGPALARGMHVSLSCHYWTEAKRLVSGLWALFFVCLFVFPACRVIEAHVELEPLSASAPE